MKTLLKTLGYVFAGMMLFSSCKKTESADTGAITSTEYTFNKATKSFGTNTDISAQITSSGGIRYVYTYLIRTNATDSLISVFTPNNATTYELKIPTAAFPLDYMSKATGIKVLAKQSDNSTIEGFIKITYFDPALPQLKNFPATLTANLTPGEKTTIAGNITSDYGITQVDIYDDFKTENVYELVNSFAGLANLKQYALNYAYGYRKASQHIKIVAKDIYNQSNELIIAMPVDVTVFKPKLLNFPTTITPVIGGATPFTGKITSVAGLKQIDIYDDNQGSFVLLSSVTNLNSSMDYNLTGSYTYHKRATSIKIIAIDNDDVQAELIIPLDVNYGSTVYRDVNMNAQTVATKTIFFDNGTTSGNCNLNASEATMAFLFYGTSTGPSFYSPTNTSGVANNFKCNGTGWAIANAGSLRATRFRVLVKGASAGIDNVYAQMDANNIDVLDDAFFSTNSIAAPAGSSARFDPAVTATTSLFNLTTAYLIYARIPDPGAATYKNALIRIKEVTSSIGTSTVKFDFYIQK